MIIERISNQIVIKESQQVDTFGFQRIMDYLDYLEITSKSKATQDDADRLADEQKAEALSKQALKAVVKKVDYLKKETK